MTIKNLRHSLEQRKGRQAQIQSSITSTQSELRDSKRSLYRHEKAREIIREVGLKTQQSLQYHISDITSLALEAVFIDPYELIAEFVERRNKTECDLYFARDGIKVDPLTASGGGAVDIASFALRVASWSMQLKRSRPILLLDEPFRYVSADLLPKASAMLKEVSVKLGLQIIMVTHSEELMAEADKIFETHIRKGITDVN